MFLEGTVLIRKRREFYVSKTGIVSGALSVRRRPISHPPVEANYSHRLTPVPEIIERHRRNVVHRAAVAIAVKERAAPGSLAG
jgi:hypothetical protein